LGLKLTIENFKSIKRLELLLDDLTVLVGPPAGGKSNILDALAIMGYLHRFKVLDREYRNSASNLEPPGLIARFQDLPQLFRYYDLTKTVKLMMSGDVSLSYEISYVKGALKVVVDGKQLPWDFKTLKSDPMSDVQNFAKNVISFETRLYGFDRYGLMSEAYSLPYLCGLHFRFSNPSAAVDAPSYILSEFGWNAPYIVRRHFNVVSKINEVLKEYMGERIELKVRKTGEALIFDNDYEVDAVGVSETVFRTLYTLLALESSLFYAKFYGLEKKFVVLLEEPEAHVFPYFLNVLAEHIGKVVGNVYVVVSTHNPLFVSRLQDCVKNLRTYYVYRGVDGSTSACMLDVDKMARDLATMEDVLLGPPPEVLKRYAVEVVKGVESRTGAS
jgi:hypothetical protein